MPLPEAGVDKFSGYNQHVLLPVSGKRAHSEASQHALLWTILAPPLSSRSWLADLVG